MQTYLGDYPGARSNPESKFIRAVNSVINQEKQNWELVIVSDGCKKTKELYYEHYDDNPNISFVYVDKPEHILMYKKDGDKKYYRGIPRQAGRAVATGDWIAYLDADDFILKNATIELEKFITLAESHDKKIGKETKFLFNTRIIEHVNYAIVVKAQSQKHGLSKGVATIESDLFEIDGLPDKWFSRGSYNTFMMATACMVHKSDIPKVKWCDIESATVSEDIQFAHGVLEDPEMRKYVNLMAIPYYVRCHYDKLWDV